MEIVTAEHVGVRTGAGTAGARPRAFTLIELLVVIVVIGVLITAIGLVGGHVIHSQKVRLTQTTMAAVKAAIDQFAEENPLRSVYDSRNRPTFGPYVPYRPTFGPYVPYQLVTPPGLNWILEPTQLRTNPYDLKNRLWRDLGNPTTPMLNWVYLDDGDPVNDDIRALHAYLKAFTPDVLEQVPRSALKPLTGTAEFINPGGAGAAPNSPGALDVLGIHDAWGVPLDYFLYVKVELDVQFDGSNNWRVTDRIPVLRSRGIDLEVYEQWYGSSEAPPDTEGTRIYSDPFPAPVANHNNGNFWKLGTFSAMNTSQNGWARAVGAYDLYVNGDHSDPHMFGYVP